MLICGNIGGGGLVWFTMPFFTWDANELETELRRGQSCVLFLFLFRSLGLVNSTVSKQQSK